MATTSATARHEVPAGLADGAHHRRQGGQPAANATVRDQLLEQALDLICMRGFNGFSYRDLAERVGVKTSSIHYYFPTKEDLALAAVQEYAARVARHIETIDPGLPLRAQAERYLEPWRDGLKAERVCVAGMLACEALCLPESVHTELQSFQGMNESWLTALLRRAQAAKAKGTGNADTPGSTGSPEALAQILFAALQNGQVSARLFGSPERLEPAAQLLLAAADPQQASHPQQASGTPKPEAAAGNRTAAQAPVDRQAAEAFAMAAE
ncbi:TetR/AcrR family transcriptional regulator [Paracidovorax citrulli]